MRLISGLVALVVLSACAGDPYTPAPRPAIGAIPSSCQPAVWLVDRECRRSTYYRCEGGPSDRVFVYFDMPAGPNYVHDRRSHGIFNAAIAREGEAWWEQDPISLGDAAALLDGQPTIVASSYEIANDETGTYQLRIRPAMQSLTVDGITMRRFDGEGYWQEPSFGREPMVGQYYYIDEAGLFIDGAFQFWGPNQQLNDGTPLRLSLDGPIQTECVRAGS